jgi:DNA integrity scanning protein DisA with diadenylate cyclase activity
MSTLSLGDYIKESLEFENSAEYYKLQKECLELELLSIDYMLESSCELSDDLILFDLNESAAISESVGEKINIRIKGITEKIGNMWKKIIGALKVFFKNVINIFTNEQNKKIKELEEQIKENKGLKELNKLNEEEIAKLKAELNSVMNKLSESNVGKTLLNVENAKLKYKVGQQGREIHKLDIDIDDFLKKE